MEKNTILNIDANIGIKQVPTESVDLIMTNPPYNIAHKQGTKGVSFEFGERDYFENEEDYLKWADTWIKEAYRTLTPDGYLFIWQDKSLPLKQVIQSNNFEIKNVIVWIKSNSISQLKKENFLSSVEFGILATKKGVKRKKQTFNITHQNEMNNAIIEKMDKLEREEFFKYIPSDFFTEQEKCDQFINENGLIVIKTPIVTEGGRLKYSIQKLSVTEKIIKLFTNEGDTVMDLFMGLGIVAEVSIKNSRNFYGFEKDITYHQMAITRVLPYLVS